MRKQDNIYIKDIIDSIDEYLTSEMRRYEAIYLSKTELEIIVEILRDYENNFDTEGEDIDLYET